MHEMGIASSILDAVRGEAGKRPGARVSKVGLRVGEWSGVDVESLRFCVEVLATGTDLAGIELDIDFRRRQNRCLCCGAVFAIEDYVATCPHCRHERTTPAGGSELELVFLELED